MDPKTGQIALSLWLRDHYDPSHVAWHYLAHKKDWYFSRDFEAYLSIVRVLETAIDYSRQPNLTEGFWIEHRIRDKMACVMACRPYVWTQPLTEEIPRMMPGAICDAPSMPSISGKVCFSGGLWVAERFRGQGLGAKACRTLHAIALLLYRPDYFIAVTEKRLEGLTRAQGWRRIEPTVAWQSWDMNLCWMDAREMLQILGTPLSAKS